MTAAVVCSSVVRQRDGEREPGYGQDKQYEESKEPPTHDSLSLAPLTTDFKARMTLVELVGRAARAVERDLVLTVVVQVGQVRLPTERVALGRPLALDADHRLRGALRTPLVHRSSGP